MERRLLLLKNKNYIAVEEGGEKYTIMITLITKGRNK